MTHPTMPHTAAAGAAFVGVAATVCSYPQVAWVCELLLPAWPWTTWLYPLIVDVLLGVAAVLVVVWRDHPGNRRWAAATVAVCAALSWAANAAHALHSTGATSWLALGAITAASVPPLGIVIAPHLAASVLRDEPRRVPWAAPTVRDVTPAPEPAPAPAPLAPPAGEPHPDPVPAPADSPESGGEYSTGLVQQGSPDAPSAVEPFDIGESGYRAYARLRQSGVVDPSGAAIFDACGLGSKATHNRRKPEYRERYEREHTGLRVVTG